MKCETCGMQVNPGEYHPHAACLMFMGCKNEQMVRESLFNLRTEWAALGYRQAIHAVKEKLGEIT